MNRGRWPRGLRRRSPAGAWAIGIRGLADRRRRACPGTRAGPRCSILHDTTPSRRHTPQVLTQVLRIVYRTISGDLLGACSRWRLRSSSGGRGRGGEAGVSPGGSDEQRSAAGAGAARRRAHRARARAARATGTRLRMSPATRRAFCFCDRQRARGKTLTAARELSQPDRRRSLKCRHLHLQVAGRSQVLSGSGGTSDDSRRKFASDRAASHAPSAAMTSAPLYFFLRFHSKTTQCCIVRNATYHGGSRSTLLAAICSWKRASFFFCPI